MALRRPEASDPGASAGPSVPDGGCGYLGRGERVGRGRRWADRLRMDRSLAGNAKLLWWWLILPALTWPADLYWTVYHAVGRA